MSKKRYQPGNRNVFNDIGLPNAEEHLVKAQLVFKIGRAGIGSHADGEVGVCFKNHIEGGRYSVSLQTDI